MRLRARFLPTVSELLARGSGKACGKACVRLAGSGSARLRLAAWWRLRSPLTSSPESLLWSVRPPEAGLAGFFPKTGFCFPSKFASVLSLAGSVWAGREVACVEASRHCVECFAVALNISCYYIKVLRKCWACGGTGKKSLLGT